MSNFKKNQKAEFSKTQKVLNQINEEGSHKLADDTLDDGYTEN